jgi:hypothetical protein
MYTMPKVQVPGKYNFPDEYEGSKTGTMENHQHANTIQYYFNSLLVIQQDRDAEWYTYYMLPVLAAISNLSLTHEFCGV